MHRGWCRDRPLGFRRRKSAVPGPQPAKVENAGENHELDDFKDQ
jgi:hypothetical protein